MHQPLNPLPTHRCWLVSSKTMTPRPERGTQLVTVAGRPVPPAPAPMYWLDAWEHNLVSYPEAVAGKVASGLTGLNGSALLMIDYEPGYSPSWRFPNPNGTKQPAWAAFLAKINADSFDTNFTALVNWSVPVGAKSWADLTAAEQESLQHVSWDYFCRGYLTAVVRAIKQILPKDVLLSFWNWPFKFGKDGKPGWWDEVMDELGWLWAELPAFMPDLYPEFYSGANASKPENLSTCTAQNASATLAYYQGNVDNALRLRRVYNQDAKVYLSVWWHYMCAQHVTTDLGYFVRDGNLAEGLFAARGHDGIALWGSVGTYRGEDINATEIVQYLDDEWAPFVSTQCKPT